MSKSFNKIRNNKLYQNKDNFLKIVEFYLFETPIESSSKRSIPFKTYGWVYGHRYKELKNRLFHYNSKNDIKFFCEDKGNRKQLKKDLKNIRI